MAFIHPTAIVDEGAIVGDGTKIWHWTHVCAGARIGENCTIGQNVYISGKVSIGDGCKIQNNVSLYDGLILLNNVFIGPSVVFTNVINPRANIEKKDEFRSTKIRHNATLGANSTIICGIEIGEYAMVAAGAVVTKSVKPFVLVQGVPAQQVGTVNESGQTSRS